MRDVPEPGDDGVRRYGHWHKSPEDKARCAVEVFGFHSSHQCTNKRKPGTERCGVHAEAPKDRVTMWFVGCGHFNVKSRGGIQTVEVAKVSEARVQLPSGRWDKIKSRSGVYHATLDEAVAHVREGLVRNCEHSAREVVDDRERLEKFDQLYPRKK